jgi:hypothetical protein
MHPVKGILQFSQISSIVLTKNPAIHPHCPFMTVKLDSHDWQAEFVQLMQKLLLD